MNPLQTEPTLSSNGIVAAISAVVAALIAFGVISLTPEQQSAAMAAIVAVLGVVGPLIAAWWARTKVTPLVAPVDEDGVMLVRADGGEPTLSAMREQVRRK